MRKSRFTEAQIIGMIKEQEAGLPTAELCRKHGLSPATFYKLKAKYGGMDLATSSRSTEACAPLTHASMRERATDECLNEEIFDSLADARRILALWRYDYNNVRPHSSLGNQTPAEARRALEQSEGSAPDALATPETDDYQTQGLSL